MSEMVDQVARAIIAELADLIREGECASLGGNPSRLARAAIQAMREPTAAMERAGDCGHDLVDGPPTSDEVWRAMIDAALNEKAPATPQRERPGPEAAQP